MAKFACQSDGGRISKIISSSSLLMTPEWVTSFHLQLSRGIVSTNFRWNGILYHCT